MSMSNRSRKVFFITISLMLGNNVVAHAGLREELTLYNGRSGQAYGTESGMKGKMVNLGTCEITVTPPGDDFESDQLSLGIPRQFSINDEMELNDESTQKMTRKEKSGRVIYTSPKYNPEFGLLCGDWFHARGVEESITITPHSIEKRVGYHCGRLGLPKYIKVGCSF